MACVYYKPSPVLYRGNKYDRKDLIEAKRQMLDTEWELMMKFRPFKRLFSEKDNGQFYEQFAKKLHFLIKNHRLNASEKVTSSQIANKKYADAIQGASLYEL